MKGALFDLDGVLIDSESLYTDFWARVGRDFRLPSPTFALDIKGTTLADILSTYFPDPQTSSMLRRRIHDFEQTMVYRLFPGVAPFLEALRCQGIPSAIVTSSDNVKMNHLFAGLPQLRQMVDIVIDGTMVSRSKPDPEGYLIAAERLGVNPSDCVVFEDSIQGLEAGRRSGAKVVGVATTNPRHVIAPLSDLVIDTFASLTPDALEALINRDDKEGR